MADPCQLCSSMPYTNTCCPPQSGISVMQPVCQTLPGGSIVNNPCYDAAANVSLWSYKFFIDPTPGSTVSSIHDFLIPIYINIRQTDITVEERIDGFGLFQPVQFSLNTTDVDFGAPPEGYQWLRVENCGRYDKGAFVEYRIRIFGDYPEVAQPICVRSGSNRLTFNPGGEYYKVPGYSLPGQLDIIKSCDVIIHDNTASVLYDYSVMNTGAGSLDNVIYNDIITYDAVSLAIGQIEVSPQSLTVGSTIPGMITVSGNLGKINPGSTVPVFYKVQVISATSPNEYGINNVVTIAAGDAELSDTSSLTLDAVQLSSGKCYIAANGSTGTFRMTVSNTGLSPQTKVNLIGQIIIPDGLVVKFTDFDGCTASLQNEGPIPLNANVTNAAIDITCEKVTIPAGGSIQKNIKFTLISTSSFQSRLMVTGTLHHLNFLNSNTQLFLGATDIPASASVDIISAVTSN